MNLKKRLLAIAVTGAVTVTSFGLTAFAAEYDPWVEIDGDNDTRFDEDESYSLDWDYDDDGAGDIANGYPRWSSSNDDVVDVDDDGEIRTYDSGKATVTVTIKFEDYNRVVRDSITITVDDTNNSDDDDDRYNDRELHWDADEREYYYINSRGNRVYDDGSDRAYLTERYGTAAERQAVLAGGSSASSRTPSRTTSRLTTALSRSATEFDRSVSLTQEASRTTVTNAAKSSGTHLDNYASVTVDALHGASSGTVNFDTRVNGSLMGRLQIGLSNAANLTSGTIKLGVHYEDSTTESVHNMFDKNFSNPIHVIKCDQGNFGMNVKLFVNVGSGVSARDLVLYSYDASKNSYAKMSVTDATVDRNGFLSFTTSTGGTIIVSEDGALSR